MMLLTVTRILLYTMSNTHVLIRRYGPVDLQQVSNLKLRISVTFQRGGSPRLEVFSTSDSDVPGVSQRLRTRRWSDRQFPE